MLEPDVIRGYERKLDSLIEVAGSDDPETFALIVRLLDSTVRRLPEAAQQLRDRDRYSYTDLARALGVHRSAARQRFGPHGPNIIEPTEEENTTA